MAAQAVRHLEEEVSIAIIRKADALTQVVTDLLKPHGLSPTQYNVLRILRGAGKDGASCKEISNRLIAMVRNTTTHVSLTLRSFSTELLDGTGD